MIAPLILPDAVTLKDIEEGIKKINSSQSPSLQLNKDSISKRRGALHDAARLQMFITWARKTKKCELHFHSSNIVENVLNELCDYAPGIAVTRLSSGVRVGSNFISRRDALKPAAEKMNYTDSEQINKFLKGRTVDMTCVSGSEVQYLAPLFTARRATAVKQKEDMHQLLLRISEEVSKSDFGRIPHNILESCSVFASELIQNTQDHAVEDHEKIAYHGHVEGMIISWTALEEPFYGQDFFHNEKLKRFWTRESVPAKGGSTRVLRCLQMSFFDSGPGFAARSSGHLNSAISLDAERKLLMQCLKLRYTTKEKVGAGLGLATVLETLKEIGGLIRIRSGRHCIFNVFDRAESSKLFDFFDWNDHALGEVAGAVISILIPLRRT